MTNRIEIEHEEMADLRDRLSIMQHAAERGLYRNLPWEYRVLLWVQMKLMQMYVRVLRARRDFYW